MSLSRPLVVLLSLLALLPAAPASAAVANRITAPITAASRHEVPDSVPMRARTASDLGPVSSNLKLTGSLRFLMTDAQTAALDQLLADQQNPASPQYHHWLTPVEFGEQFGLSSADLSKVSAWLTAQGFTVTGVGNGGLFVRFEGTAASAQAAFATSLHTVSSNGETHFANITPATVPAALANVVGGITGLNDFRPHPHLHMRAGAVPQYTATGTGGGAHYLVPGDLYSIYNMEPVLQAGYTGAGIGTGANCKSVPSSATCGDIAVVGQVDLVTDSSGSPTDVTSFRSLMGLSAGVSPITVHANHDPGPAQTCANCSPNVDDLDESTLDVEWAGAMAPGATILFVNGPNVVGDALTQAIDQNLAPIITSSYGNCEASWGSSILNAYNLLFKQAAAQGQTILAAAGDNGSADCDAGVPATEGLTVDFPASSPYVTALGGTMFNDGSATGATTYWLGTNSTFAAPPAVPAATVSAVGYIPELVWNENDATANDSFSASGGGVSAFFPKPAWQVETGTLGFLTAVPADASRDVPDIALAAAAAHDPFLFCVQGSCASNQLHVAGGTSFDSQIFGGMLALIVQKTGSRAGLINPTLYALGNQAAYYNGTGTSVFHDVTAGNNNDPCSAGTPNCPGGSMGYSAGPGYDLITGWGSVNLNNLAAAWTQVTPLGTGSIGSTVSTTTLATSPACSISQSNPTGPCTLSAAAGSTVTLTATVTGGSGTPTGTVQFLDNNVALGAPVQLNGSGIATFAYNASCSALGQRSLTAVYSGNATYSGSKAPALNAGPAGNSGATITNNGSYTTNPLIVTVTTGSCSDFSLTPGGTGFNIAGSNANITVAAGGTIPSLTLSVAPLNGFTGTVTLTATATNPTGAAPTLTITPQTLTFTGSSTNPQTATLAFTGITAKLHLPATPGHRSPEPWYAGGLGVTLASLLWIGLPRRRRLGGLLMLVIGAVLMAGAIGCGSSTSTVTGTGGGGTGTGGSSNPQAGIYTVTVQASYSSGSNTITHASVITYAIN